jgi:hypothetical protein
MPTIHELAEDMKLFTAVGIGLAATVAAFLFQKDELANQLRSDPTLGMLTVALVCTTFWWLLSWLFFGYKEIKLLAEFIDFDSEYFDPSRSTHIAFPLILAIGFGVMIGFGLNLPVYIGAVFFTLSTTVIGDSVATKLMARDLFGGKAMKGLSSGKTKELQELLRATEEVRTQVEVYYFESLYFARTALAMCILALAWLVYYGVFIIASTNPTHIGYLLTILAILVNEIPVRILRRRRNGKIRSVINSFRDAFGKEPSLALLRQETAAQEG